MKMQQNSRVTLRDLMAAAGGLSHRFIADETTQLGLGALNEGDGVCGCLDSLRDRNIFLAVETQLACAVALIALDGLARRIMLCPPDLSPRHVSSVLADGEVDVIVCDQVLPEYGGRRVIQPGGSRILGATVDCAKRRPTEWVLFTSGTTGGPKMAVHTLESLSGHLPAGPPSGKPPVWGTFYDIRRYGGLQVLLRALLGAGSMVLSSPGEHPGAFLARAGAFGVTHILGTPSHWRRAMMTHEADRIAPDYVRLSGEVADQAILDRLRAAYPKATVAHAFASTEAGVAFEVRDGLAGFPAHLVGPAGGGAELRIIDGTLSIRSARLASSYLGGARNGLADEAGFVDTGDMVELRGGRYYFVGRKEGIINIGGQKVHPEEVEAVINRHPTVEMSLVKGRRSPITGAIVVADVVLRPHTTPAAVGPAAADPQHDQNSLGRDILEFCRGELAAHKVPAMIRIVPSLEVAPSGKLARMYA
jgi:acyl-coenzyme A synthetase/AMP-(fatty) acid ligase